MSGSERWRRSGQNRRGGPTAGRRVWLRPEPLEDRAVPSTFTVLNLADSGPGSLRDAVAQAEANPGPDQIFFAPGVQGTITLTSGELVVTDDLDIIGPGADLLTVSGNDNSRIFAVTGPFEDESIAVSVINLTISHGHGPNFGGGISNVGDSNLTLSHVVLSNNVASGSAQGDAFGGGVASFGNLTVLDSVVSDNLADASTAEESLGGGICSLGGTLSVINSTIRDNESLAGAAPELQFAIGFGGGISVAGGRLLLSGSAVSHNRVVAPSTGSAFGGGVDLVSATAEIERTTIDDNEAVGGSPPRDDQVGAAQGGGIRSFNSTTTLSACFLRRNAAVAGPGGEADGGGILNEIGRLEIDGCELTGNRAVGGSSGTASMFLIADVGSAHGGAIANRRSGTAVIRDSTISSNEAVGGAGNTATDFLAFVGTAVGGGIYNSFGPIVTSVPVPPTTLTLIHSHVEKNEALGGGGNTGHGAMAFVGAGLGGGIANLLGGTADVESSVVSGNQAIGGSRNDAIGARSSSNLGAGGGVFNALGNFQLDDDVFLPPSIVAIGSNSRLVGNRARGGESNPALRGGSAWGGAIAGLFDATTSVARSTLARNVAAGGHSLAVDGGNGLGGGAFNDATSSLALAASRVIGNQALGGPPGIGGDPGAGIGGGVYNLGRFAFDAVTLILRNFASTSNDDTFG